MARDVGKLIERAALEQCPEGYSMRLRSKGRWACLAEAWNQGIDSRLEALTERSRADASTGEVIVHPLELKTLIRRLMEAGSPESELLGTQIGESLGLEVSILWDWD